jgi:hypothetical protein
MFEYTCPKCQKTTTVAELASGTVTRCAGCNQQLRVVLEEDVGSVSLVGAADAAAQSGAARRPSVAAAPAPPPPKPASMEVGKTLLQQRPTNGSAAPRAPAALMLLRRTTCPHCWKSFAPEEVLWISAHTDLLGDPRLGKEEQQRFLPTRFDVDANAMDSKGFVCQRLACPKCHLPIPRVLLETEPLFVSILGSPACGKSYFLTAMTWELRRIMPLQFALSFTDADTISNRSLNEYEEALFLNSHSDEPAPLADLIRKTELQGQLYDSVMFGNQTVSYPRPFLFSMRLQEKHPRYQTGQHLGRVLCLYDNAGEHFQAGQDSTANPVTQHLAQSRVLLFLFDPTQDQRFRRLCQERGKLPPGVLGDRSSRQESVLLEAAARVRRYSGLSESAKVKQPLVVIVTKADVWSHLLEDGSLEEPWAQSKGTYGLDLERIEQRSRAVGALLKNTCSEVVTAAESFAQLVLYVPVSALGSMPLLQTEKRALAIPPGQIRPQWVTVPLLYALCRWINALVPGLRPKAGRSSSVRGPGTST